MFILNYLITVNRAKKASKIYAFFADFRQAFDSVSHDLLWKKLKMMGLSTKMIKNLAAFYAMLTLRLNTRDGWTKEVDYKKSVAGGSP